MLCLPCSKYIGLSIIKQNKQGTIIASHSWIKKILLLSLSFISLISTSVILTCNSSLFLSCIFDRCHVRYFCVVCILKYSHSVQFYQWSMTNNVSLLWVISCSVGEIWLAGRLKEANVIASLSASLSDWIIHHYRSSWLYFKIFLDKVFSSRSRHPYCSNFTNTPGLLCVDLWAEYPIPHWFNRED